MKNTVSILALYLAASPLIAQQSTLRGEVSIINSKYETKTREYVPNAQVEEDFNRAQPTTTHADGLFHLVMVGVQEKESITFTVKREGLDVVNIDALSAVAGQKESVKIYMATPQKIAEYKRQYYQIGKTAAEKTLEEKLKKLQDERQTLLVDKNADKNRIADLETQLGQLEAQRFKIDEDARELARRYAPINLDDASPLYQEAFSWFQKGELEKALDILVKANLAGQVKNILDERIKITAVHRELIFRDSIQKQHTADVLSALSLKTDMHQSRFEFDSTTVCFELMLALDSADYDNTFRFAYFLQIQNQRYRAIELYEKCLVLAKTNANRAALQNNLGALYKDNNRMVDAEKYYKEALKGYRILDEKTPDTFLPYLGATLNNLGEYYRVNQRMPEAEKSFDEALSIRRKLAGRGDDFLRSLASTLNNMGNYYSDNKKEPEAEKAYDEALSIRRKLVEKDSAFLPDLAATLNNVGLFYAFGDSRHIKSEYEKASNNALILNWKLQNTAVFSPISPDLRDYLEAEKAFNEALSIRRKLAEKNPDAYLPDVALTLNNLANFFHPIYMFLDSSHNCLEIEKIYTEALSIRRKLAEKNPDAFLPSMIITLNNLGDFYHTTWRCYDPEAQLESIKIYTEVLSIQRKLAEKNPDVYLPDVALALNNLANSHLSSKNMPEAEKMYNEALLIYRRLAEENPDAFLPDVATTLNNLGIYHQTLKQYSQAFDQFEESLHILQVKVLAGQTYFFTNWAKVMRNIAKPEYIIGDLNPDEERGNYNPQIDSVIRNKSEINDYTAAQQQFVFAARAAYLLATSCDSLRIKGEASRRYVDLSWWAVFVKNYTMAEQAGLRCLALDETQILAWTNIGHARWLSGKEAAAKAAWLNLKGKIYYYKPYDEVLKRDWQDLESAGVAAKGAFDEARKWVEEEW